jgi:acetyl esterase/lipase
MSMPDLSHIHPELRKALRFSVPIVVNARTLWFIRTALRMLPVVRTAQDIAIRTTAIAGAELGRTIILRIYRPVAHAKLRPGLLWMHGGGYVMGAPGMEDASCAEYAREVGAIVVSVDYRLAPEHPFPAALYDCYAALKWMFSHASELGVDAARIAIGGASAGGGLAAALAQLAFDRKEVEPVFQLLRYPMLDDRTTCEVVPAANEPPVWNRASNLFGWRSYLGAAWHAAEMPACAVPARRANLAGLPPAWIGVGTVDLFHAEDVAYARRLREAGVECELRTVEGAYHGFDMVRHAMVTREFHRAEIAALKKYLARGVVA